MGDRAIGAKNGGVISLHGEKTKSQYVRLTKTMSKSSYTAMVDDPAKISGWKRGDKVVISTTSFYPDKNDYLTVKSIDSDGTITFTDRSKHKHYGDLQRFTNNANNQVYAVDQRAYVANLSRNIVIQGSTDSLKDEIGAHVIVLQGGEGYIDSVEFTRVGQKSKLGRYPFHWHRVGDVSGQYIKNSSIHGSFHRCITIHNSQRATVTGNTCYDFMGHGFFLEEGNEVNNVLQYNLGIYGRKILKGAVLASDNNMHPADRFPGPATFWISNPDNDIRYNAAVGCEGTGYWMSFRQSLKCGSKPGTGCVPASQGKSNVFPASTRTLFFSDNVAMATVTGFTWDGAPDGAAIKNNFNRDKTASGDFKLVGAHYRPTNQIPIISNLHMYKCAQTGIRVRGEQMHFPGAVFADVATGAFFSSNQVVRDSLFVGVSANHDTIEFTYHFDGSIDIARRHPSRYVGIRISDGPWVLGKTIFDLFTKCTPFNFCHPMHKQLSNRCLPKIHFVFNE
jgi:cell migration-inducing and hyaluronan-binding protein